MTTATETAMLAPGTVLADRFTIEATLGVVSKLMEARGIDEIRQRIRVERRHGHGHC